MALKNRREYIIEIRAGETRKKRADSRGCHEANNLISPADVRRVYVLD